MFLSFFSYSITYYNGNVYIIFIMLLLTLIFYFSFFWFLVYLSYAHDAVAASLKNVGGFTEKMTNAQYYGFLVI
jgi:hypothetical protein